MLKNYFKIAIAVLKRRKFFTFISLFGISFTLTILIVLTAFLDHLLSPSYPDTNRGRELFLSRVELQSKEGWVSKSPLSYSFFHDYALKLKTYEKMAIYTSRSTNAYRADKKIAVDLTYTNNQYWDVYQFDFIEGKPFNLQQLDHSDPVVVISDEFSRKYFGEAATAVGKYIDVNNAKYKVIGVVKSAPYLNGFCFADAYLPYTLMHPDLKNKSLQGDFSATVLFRDKADKPVFRAELKELVKKVPNENKELDKVYLFADNYLAVFTRGMFGNGEKSGETFVLTMVAGVIFLFMLLPTINLVNINISRIMERSSEIGVRKAFGASSKTLTYQFIVENLILTLFGGLLGLLLSAIVIYYLNNMQIAQGMYLKINLTVLFYSLLACVIFGLLSGVYPAWRMSKLNVVTALKANN